MEVGGRYSWQWEVEREAAASLAQARSPFTRIKYVVGIDCLKVTMIVFNPKINIFNIFFFVSPYCCIDTES